MSNKQTLTALLEDHEIYHSDFQIAEFIINGDAHGNTYGMYKQALRELDKRKRGLQQRYIDRARKCDEYNALIPYDVREQTCDEREIYFALADLRRVIEHTEREFRQFYTHAIRLKGILGDITPERRRELDKGMWEHRARHMVAMDLLTLGHFQEKTFNMISSFPTKERNELLAFTKDRASVEQWYAALPSLSEVIDCEALEPCNVKELV